MRLISAAIVLAILTGCSGWTTPRDNDDDSLELFLAQQRLRQQQFQRDMRTKRLVQCEPVGFAVECHR
jgi:hypothetical protein